ncbi:MAG TPA: universal stress protein [Candidatus Dormibacteraeota bacterium]
MIILVAIGEPSNGQPTLARAAELAGAAQAAVVVLHVRERHYARGVVWDEPAPADGAELVNESTFDLRRQNIACRGAVRLAPAGRVAEAIVGAAVDLQADLIIVGRSMERSLTRLMTAHTSQRVVRLAPMPVLVVPRASGVRLSLSSARR